MKKLFTNAWDCIHAFAGRTQNDGRSSNVFFEGGRIYSYGYHYLLGEFITNSSGDLAIMINDKGYSQTTSGHISALKQATRQYRQFLRLQTDECLVFNQLETLAKKLQAARKKELYINPAEYLHGQFVEYLAWSGKTAANMAQINAVMSVFRGSDMRTYLKDKADAIERDRIAAIKAEKKRIAGDVRRFYAYKIDRFYSSEDYIRLSACGHFVETSQRVRVSVKDAAVLYSLIIAGRDIKGHVIDGHTVISINGTLQIGCHHINKTSIHRTGKVIIAG